ncbi:MAG TPA: hypothetical protein VGJ48_23190 [Pyrinomonadaceae bacterium]|jgi:hypothetical protein
MAGFSLTKSGKTFDFDTNGEVKRNGAKIGKWTTNNAGDNQLVVTEESGTVTNFSPTWKFNSNNQLEIYDGNNLLLNFHGLANVVPFYKAEDAVLMVKPDRGKPFGFNLNGEWGMTPGHDLTIKLGSVTSTIDGYVEDNRSRFIYKFLPKVGTIEMYTLTFAGSWSSRTNDGKHIVKFNYTRKGNAASFSLPEGVMFDHTINQLVYDYDKNGMTRRIQFAGELKVNSNFVITYKLDRQKSGTPGKDLVGSTTFTIQGKFNANNFTGNLEMVLVKNDGSTPGTKLVIGGSFEKDLGGSKLGIAFNYTYERANGEIKQQSFSLSGSFQLKDNGTLTWSFSNNAVTKVTTITFGVEDFEIGDFSGNVQLQIKTEGGQLKEFKMLLGFTF